MEPLSIENLKKILFRPSQSSINCLEVHGHGWGDVYELVKWVTWPKLPYLVGIVRGFAGIGVFEVLAAPSATVSPFSVETYL